MRNYELELKRAKCTIHNQECTREVVFLRHGIAVDITHPRVNQLRDLGMGGERRTRYRSRLVEQPQFLGRPGVTEYSVIERLAVRISEGMSRQRAGVLPAGSALLGFR